ncbi:MAG: NAD-binding oxidoreductase [Myxococcota bacterium]|nr:NAD-binding oxidoreductase [Myxococcota bacterium]
MQAVEIAAISEVAQDHLELELVHPQAAAYTRPGQFVKIGLEGHEKPGFFAIASAPGAERMRFLVQVASPLTEALAACVVGDSVLVSEPMGRGFAMEALAGRTPLFFATGSGISAIRAVIESQEWSGQGARLYYGARTWERMPWTDTFEAWRRRGVEVIPVLSRADESWDGARGHIQAVYAEDPVEGAQAALVLCGLKGMTDEATQLLVAQGMDPKFALLNF